MTDMTQFDLFDLPADDAPDETALAYQQNSLASLSEERKAPVLAQQEQAEKEIDLIALMNIVIEDKDRFSEDPDRLMKSFKLLLQSLIEARYVTYVDLYFAEFITQQKGFKNAQDYLGYCLLSLLVSRAYGLGHTALPQHYLNAPHQWFIENTHKERRQVIQGLLKVVFDVEVSLDLDRYLETLCLETQWQPILENVSLPLLVTKNGIYLERNYVQEGVIVSLFKSVRELPLTDAENHYVSERLQHYFQAEKSAVNWQQFAAANAILNNISVISGGPGTGKTTTVFKILQTLIDLHRYRESERYRPFTILLAAPTGKAAARLSESILGQVQQLQERVQDAPIEIEEAVRAQLALIPSVGQTLHRLLVIHPFTRKPRYNHFNPLNFDVLVVDEASMIDQQMLVQLIGALPAHGRVIFLGDKDQLASVEAGAIMHELCVSENYSQAHFSRLTALLGFDAADREKLAQELVNSEMPAFNYLSFLKKSYRFRQDSALGKLATIVNNADEKKVVEQFTSIMALMGAEEALSPENQSLKYTALPIEEMALKQLLSQAFKPYVTFIKEGQGIEFAEAAFKVFSKLGVLSARRTGENGAVALNELIRKTLFPYESHREFFHGLPIMITHNSVENNLFNGDIGLILRNETGQLRAYFEGVDSARVFSIHALPKFETAFAMTIHKSQGSEFQKILLFLGDEPSVFLTKELFYTGITRAKESVQIFANDAVIQAALSGRVDRFSFIHARLSE